MASIQQMQPVRVLYSFPQKIGAGRVCELAWQQVSSIARAGADVTVFPGVLHKPFADSIVVQPTLSRGKARISYKLVGDLRAFALHDYIVSRRLPKIADRIDVIHLWPLGASRTLKVAARLGIPTVLERPNTHTRYAYEVVRRECEKLGVDLPVGYEHAYNADVLRIEEEEYKNADFLLCPSDFVLKTFLDYGFPLSKLARHSYGFDEKRHYPATEEPKMSGGITMLFGGLCAVRKGLHYALEAWLASPAHEHGTFLIAGRFLPAYAEKLKPMLDHPSVRVLGERDDLPELMRQSDILVLPSIEEGSALVTSEARASGCVILVSESTGAVCKHMQDALVHRTGDVKTLTEHITMLHENRALLCELRRASLRTISEITWTASGRKLLEIYRSAIQSKALRNSYNPSLAHA